MILSGTSKKILLASLLLALVVVSLPTMAHAKAGVAPSDPKGVIDDLPETKGLDIASTLISFASNTLAWGILTIVWIAATVVGFFLSLLTWIIEVMLNLNSSLVNSPVVQTGFGATLAVANLGFVLGIVIIGIMTILRRESYGIKQTLWKLLVAAILVNFGLVIAGPIISFSNNLTLFFMEPINGGGFRNFASALTGSFQPQRLFVVSGDSSGADAALGSQVLEALASPNAPFGTILDALWVVVFVVFTLILMATVLVAFIVMLFVRYLTLSILLIIMPFAWLSWVFPNFKRHFTRWWSAFFRWTFFAPIVTFFLYLAILTSSRMPDPNSGALPDPNDPFGSLAVSFQSTAENPVVAAISTTAGDFLSKVFSPALQSLVILGLMAAGIFVADKLSIHTADAALGAIRGIRDGAIGYVGGKIRSAPAAFTTKPTEKTGFRGVLQKLNPAYHSGKALHKKKEEYEFIKEKTLGIEPTRGQRFANWIIKKGDAYKREAGIDKPAVGFMRSMWNGAGKGSGLWGKRKITAKELADRGVEEEKKKEEEKEPAGGAPEPKPATP